MRGAVDSSSDFWPSAPGDENGRGGRSGSERKSESDHVGREESGTKENCPSASNDLGGLVTGRALVEGCTIGLVVAG
eukprot:scaffold108809_cov21-Tisochrysis_lutea.AAC.2